MKPFFLGVALATATTTFAQTLTTNQKLDDFNQLVSNMRAKYGPLEYKKETQGIDLDAMVPKYTQEITETKTNGDFYYTINRFIAAFHDGHFGANIPSTYRKSLGIATDLVGEKVLIDTVNRNLLSESEFPFKKGDEIVSVDGVPTAEAVAQIQQYIGNGFERSARRRAATALFTRAASRMPVPKSDFVTIEVKRRGSDLVDRISLKWKATGEQLDEATSSLNASKLLSQGLDENSRAARLSNYKMLSIKDSLVELLGKDRVESSYQCSGSTRIKIPEGATMIMDTPFVAYYWPTAKGNLGYLRIPHYYPVNEVTGAAEYQLRYEQYEYAVSVLEKNTVGLVIDQDHNCGGSVDYLEKIVGLFMTKEYMPMNFRFMAGKADLIEWKSFYDQSAINTIEYKLSEKVYDLIKDTWMKGERMTPMTSFNALTALSPNTRAHYTKPIVMLIDENSGSGGDAFPSLLQGYGRAKLIGTRTMGLGGHVVPQAELSNSGIQYRMTRSLFFRPDGVAVENNGAVPDLPYTITEDDFTGGYLGYREFYTNALLKEIP